jgi:non-heme chloroperoxidase
MAHLTMRDGAQLHYHDLGRGEPVMLLHGFAMPAALWIPFVAPLLHRYRFILPDLRGFGGSHNIALAQPCLLTQHANDVADLLAGLNLHGVRLGGLSMGACTALQYQRLYGFDRIRSYLHMDQSPCVRNTAHWQYGLLGAQQQDKISDWQSLRNELEAFRHKPFHKIPPDLRKRLWHTLGEFFGYAFHHPALRFFTGFARHELLIRRIAPVTNWPIYMDVLRSYTEDDYDWRPSLSNIRIPMTVMVGMQSAMYPAEGQLLIEDYVPQAKTLRFDNCGHAIPFEAPAKFTRELRQFLKAA